MIYLLTLWLATTQVLAHAEQPTTPEQREEIQQNLQDGLVHIRQDIALLEEKLKSTTGATKKRLQQEVVRLEENQKALTSEFKKLQSSTGQAWTHLQAGIKNSMGELSAALKKAKASYHRDGEPSEAKDEKKNETKHK